MKKYTMLKRFAAVVMMLMLVVSIAALPAHALYGSPSGAAWSGMTAVWTAPDPSEGEVSYYSLRLFKDHSYINDFTPSYTSYNLSGSIEINGPGFYTFSVRAVYADGTKSSSVSSSIYKYSIEEQHTHVMNSIPFSYPTCTEKGCKGYYVCSDCGKAYWDEDGNNEITDIDEAFTPALGHAWGEWKVVKQPTTASEGKAQRVCQNDPDHIETKELPKLKSDSEVVTLAEEKKTEADDETKSTEEESKETTETVGPSDATKPTVKVTVTDSAMGSWIRALLASPMMLMLLICAAIFVFIIIPAVIIIIVIVVKKRKKDNTPPPAPEQASNIPPSAPIDCVPPAEDLPAQDAAPEVNDTPETTDVPTDSAPSADDVPPTDEV